MHKYLLFHFKKESTQFIGESLECVLDSSGEINDTFLYLLNSNRMALNEVFPLPFPSQKVISS